MIWERQAAPNIGRYSIQVALALSVICSLTAAAIISKNNLTNYPWVELAASAIPIPIALYFRNRIVHLGQFAYAAILILALSAALLFGI